MQLNSRYVVNAICIFRRKINIDSNAAYYFVCFHAWFQEGNIIRGLKVPKTGLFWCMICTYLYESDIKVNYDNYMGKIEKSEGNACKFEIKFKQFKQLSERKLFFK